MPTDINTKISPALHPDNVKGLDGYDESTASYLSSTVTAFTNAYEGIAAVLEAKSVVNANHAWTPERRIIELGQLADKKLASISKSFDTTRANLLKQITHIEGELSAPVQAKSGTAVAAEIRAHVKALSFTERTTFIQQAIKEGDEISLTALLGAPSYLSGLDAKSQGVYLRQFHHRMQPEKANLLKVLRGAADLIADRGGLVFTQLEKAVGAKSNEVQQLRRAHEAATKAVA